MRVALAMPPAARSLRVSVHDVAGREWAVLADGAVSAGRHEWSWNGRDARGARAAPGLYLVRAAAGERVRMSRVVLMR